MYRKYVAQSAFYCLSLSSIVKALDNKNEVRVTQLAALFPFWTLVIVPSGLVWNNLNRKIGRILGYPKDMIKLKQLFLFKPQTILLDLILNQIIYHGITSTLLVCYLYSLRKYVQKQQPKTNLPTLLWRLAPDLTKLRVLVGLISVLAQFWTSYLSVQKIDGAFRLSQTTKKSLITKEFLLLIFWYYKVVTKTCTEM